MAARTTLMAIIVLSISGCSSVGSHSLRMAGNTNFCPTGTVMVCSGLYEAERELAPSCGCAELAGGR